MPWNNGYRQNNYSRGYSNNNYSGGYSNNYGNGGYQRGNQQRKKHSGAKSGMGKNGKPFVRGWNASRQYGLVTFIATPYDGTGEHTSKSGRKWENWVVSVQPKFGASYLESGLYDPSTRKVIISKMGIVINPSAPNGGYCGRFGGKR